MLPFYVIWINKEYNKTYNNGHLSKADSFKVPRIDYKAIPMYFLFSNP